jgi:cytochrome c553
MSAYRDELSAEQIESLAAYIKASVPQRPAPTVRS